MYHCSEQLNVPNRNAVVAPGQYNEVNAAAYAREQTVCNVPHSLVNDVLLAYHGVQS